MSYLVDIPICVYNHESFLVQMLDGILKQQTNFKYRIIIGDDSSNDNSRNIISEYSLKYPNIIFPHFHQSNLGVQANSSFVFSKCTSKYVALCDGDDYWTDPYKLQKQVDFLEANEQYVMCFHPVKILLKNGDLVDDFITKEALNKLTSPEITQNDLLEIGNFIHTPSVLFRNIIPELPMEFKYSTAGDYFLYIILTGNGLIGKLNDTMAVYRYGFGTHSSLHWIEVAKNAAIYHMCILSYLKTEQAREKFLSRSIDHINDLIKHAKEDAPANLILAKKISMKNLAAVFLIKIRNKFKK